MPQRKASTVLAIIFALVAWTGVFLQFYSGIPLFMKEPGRTVAGVVLQLCSFYTIQNNVLAALCLSAFGLKARLSWLGKPSVFAATVVNITIVALVYNLVLRATYHPIGLARVGDEIVHVLTPLLFIIYWLAYVPKQELTYRGGFVWLIYPVIYLLYILIRGAFTGLYPYFFLDVGKFGYPKVMVNIAVLIIVFLMMNMLYIFIGRAVSRNQGR